VSSAVAARGLIIVALAMTALALAICLAFVLRTTGGTLFLFSTLSPVLVGLSTLIVLGILLWEYRRAHALFITERHPAGSVVFREGEHGDCAYFIRRGEVEVIDGHDGRPLARLGVGDHFGEMALLSDRPRNATVVAVTPVELAVLGKHNFLSMMRLLPTTEEAILNTVRQRAFERDLGGPLAGR
jgi:hypothetical protein